MENRGKVAWQNARPDTFCLREREMSVKLIGDALKGLLSFWLIPLNSTQS